MIKSDLNVERSEKMMKAYNEGRVKEAYKISVSIMREIYRNYIDNDFPLSESSIYDRRFLILLRELTLRVVNAYLCNPFIKEEMNNNIKAFNLLRLTKSLEYVDVTPRTNVSLVSLLGYSVNEGIEYNRDFHTSNPTEFLFFDSVVKRTILEFRKTNFSYIDYCRLLYTTTDTRGYFTALRTLIILESYRIRNF